MKKYILFLITLPFILLPVKAQRNEILVSDIKTLQVTVNNDWQLPPILNLDSDDYLTISFDELTHKYNRYVYVVTHCSADWSPSGISEIDYLNGFNNNPIEDYNPSFNTTMMYTHYKFHIPNENIQLTASGNYIVYIYKDNDSEQPVAQACFSVIESVVSVSATVSSNTDIDTNSTHQQVSFSINYPGYNINNPQNEVKVQVFQNERWDNMVTDVLPTYMSNKQLQYEHNRKLIFDAGNEYRRFEITDIHYANMGVNKMSFFDPYYHAELFVDPARRNYSYDVDQNGRYLIREMQASDSDIEADYLFVHFSLELEYPLLDGDVYLQGDLTYNRFTKANKLNYNPQTQLYEGIQLLKQGSYNYMYLYVPKGSTKGETAPIEGNFYEAENEYMILVYHRPFGGRYDRLIGMQTVKFRQ